MSYTQIPMKTLVNIHTGEASGEQASEKEQVLFAKLGEHESMLIALSGGTDSAYLAWAAHRVLGKRALSVTALSPSYSTYDREQLEKFLEATAIRHEFVETHEMEKEAYRANNADRCYFCKDELFAAMDQIAAERNFAATAYGVRALVGLLGRRLVVTMAVLSGTGLLLALLPSLPFGAAIVRLTTCDSLPAPRAIST